MLLTIGERTMQVNISLISSDEKTHFTLHQRLVTSFKLKKVFVYVPSSKNNKYSSNIPHHFMPIFFYNFLITGKVQGVFFRKYTQERAEKINKSIKGMVRNLPDKQSVEVMAFYHGDSDEPLKKLFEWCSTVGSPKCTIVSSKLSSVSGEFVPSDHEVGGEVQRAFHEKKFVVWR